MLTGLHQQVRKTIRRYGLLPAGSRVLVGLSGGSDSVALTTLLVDLAAHGEFSVVGCAHLNHDLRDTAERDERFCRDFAHQVGLPIQIALGGVQRYVHEHRVSVEAAARIIRYSFLNEAAETCGADRIAVGHTQDDQAETLLMKLVRGAGQAGLGGIYPRRGAIVRPLLETSRAALREWLGSRALSWVEDETNDDLANPRNRVRLRVLPELAEVLGSDPRPSIARAAALCREDGEWLDAEAANAFSAIVEPTVGGLKVGAAQLAGLPMPIQGRVLRLALRALAGTSEVGLEHVEAARTVAQGHAAGVDVPGGRVELSREMLVLLERKAGPK